MFCTSMAVSDGFLSVHPMGRSTCFTSGDINFDHLVKVMSAINLFFFPL